MGQLALATGVSPFDSRGSHAELFRAIRFHRRRVADLVAFNELVRQSSLSIEYIGAKVSKTMEQMREDIGKELSVTDRLTKLSAQLGGILGRFSRLEESAIELLRTEYNMEHARVETPGDVREEVDRILGAGGRSQGGDPRPNASGTSVTLDHRKGGAAPARVSISKFSASRGKRNEARAKVIPEVRLLEESRGPWPKGQRIGLREA
ncbi:hypothetical protein KM043_001791 [Ampulex compressa]|nr:hypothetical protein KM043_001791 [Ampulex compressa]